MKALSIISGIALLSAIPNWWPSGFYVLLRWFIFCSAGYVAYRFYKSKLQAWALTIGGIGFLFNPIFPIYLNNKTSWAAIDFIAAIVFFAGAYSVRGSARAESAEAHPTSEQSTESSSHR